MVGGAAGDERRARRQTGNPGVVSAERSDASAAIEHEVMKGFNVRRSRNDVSETGDVGTAPAMWAHLVS